MKTIDRMLAGFRSFKAAYYQQRPERVSALVEGVQKPEVVLIACSDSRVDPAILMNAEPGELFVIRNVANLVPPFEPDGRHHGTSAALEFAVRDLKVSDCVILGHSNCGGVRALVDTKQNKPADRPFINPWMSLMECCDIDDDVDRASQQTLRRSLANLRTFPFVQTGEDAGYLTVHGWWFDMAEGKLYRLDEDTDTLVLME
jgi:carbonic anhydrase